MNIGCIELLTSTLPWESNDIYVQDNTKLIKAVCSNKYIAEYISNAVDIYNKIKPDDYDRANRIKKFIVAAYCLNLAIINAKIDVNTVEKMLFEKAFTEFSKQLLELIKTENIDAVKQLLTLLNNGKEQTKTAIS